MAVLFNVILIATLYLYRIDVRRARRGQWMWAAFLYIVSMYIGFFRPGDALLKHGLYPGFISVMIPSIFVGALLPFLIIALLSPPREES